MSDEDLRESLAAAVRARRAELRLSQRELAKRSGVADATISKLETKQLSPSLETLAKLASGLELDLAELIAAAAPPKGKMRPSYSVSSGSWTSMLGELLAQIVSDVGTLEKAAELLGVEASTLEPWLVETEDAPES